MIALPLLNGCSLFARVSDAKSEPKMLCASGVTFRVSTTASGISAAVPAMGGDAAGLSLG